jgi:putative heme-binding domain-containing protein
LVEGLRRSQANKPVLTGVQDALERLVQTSSGAVQRKALQVAGLIPLRESAGLRKLREAAIQIALDDQKPLEERLASLAALEGATTAELAPLLGLLEARQPLDIQLAAVRLFASCDGPEVVRLLLKNWQNYTPRMQTFILDAICGRQDWLSLLLDAVEKKTVEAAALSALRQTQLLENPDATIRRRAKVLLAARINDDRKQVLGRYQAALTLAGDIRKGKEVYEGKCMKCHQLNGRGFMVGPDLAAGQNRPDESLLVDILDPSSSIVAGFKAYTVASRSGKIYTGVVVAETATSVTLRREAGSEDTVLRKDIDEMVALSKSLMPEGLEKEISLQDMANLIGYLRDQLRSRPDAAR